MTNLPNRRDPTRTGENAAVPATPAMVLSIVTTIVITITVRRFRMDDWISVDLRWMVGRQKTTARDEDRELMSLVSSVAGVDVVVDVSLSFC